MIVHHHHIAFLHFPKTAGTSIGNILLERVETRLAVASWQDASGEDLNDFDFIHGHLLYDQFENGFTEKPFLMTNFRHPIERIYSLYRFRRRRPDDPDHEAAMTMSLKDFVEAGHGSQTYISQLTDVLVPGDDGELVRKHGPGSAADRLERAKDRVDHFDHVGISEYFDYSMLLLARDLGWPPFWAMPTANSAPTRTDRDDLDDETIETIIRVAATDIQLYRHALARFQADLTRMVSLDGGGES